MREVIWPPLELATMLMKAISMAVRWPISMVMGRLMRAEGTISMAMRRLMRERAIPMAMRRLKRAISMVIRRPISMVMGNVNWGVIGVAPVIQRGVVLMVVARD